MKYTGATYCFSEHGDADRLKAAIVHLSLCNHFLSFIILPFDVDYISVVVVEVLAQRCVPLLLGGHAAA